MADFPSTIKPSLTNGYSFSSPDSVMPPTVGGGAVFNKRDYKFGPVIFNISLSLTRLLFSDFQRFYVNDISNGSGRFNMDLDSGLGVQSHIVQIEHGSLSFDGSRAPIWAVNFTVLAEATPVQDGVEEE